MTVLDGNLNVKSIKVMGTYARLLTMLLLCDVNKPVAIILCDNANMQMHIRKHTSRSVIVLSQPKQIP